MQRHSYRPKQRLCADMFTLKSKSYVLVVEYYSRFIEIANLTDTKAADVTAHLKYMSAWHGIPEVLVTDNVP